MLLMDVTLSRELCGELCGVECKIPAFFQLSREAPGPPAPFSGLGRGVPATQLLQTVFASKMECQWYCTIDVTFEANCRSWSAMHAYPQ